VAKENNMQMIDVLKRLAELDADNPNIVKEGLQVEECGMMPEMMPGMGMDIAPEKPSMPASINMSAGSGDELSNMLATIMQLAGQNKPVSAAPPLDNAPPAPGVLEPADGGSPADNMRSVIDKLNPMNGSDDDMSVAQGDVDNDGDHDMDDHDAQDDKEEVDEYDNTPSDPNKKNEFDANQFAHQENQPGQGDRMDGTSPKAYADMNEAVTDLFAQYKRFVSEN
jgi:hypothetical protein